MSTRNLIVLLLFLLSTLLKGQGALDLKIDLYPLITGQGVQLSIEKKLSEKWGIDLSVFYFGVKQSVLSFDPLTGVFSSEHFKSRWFSSTLSTNIYLFQKKERDLDFYFGPTARMQWITYIDPAYYDASEIATGFRPKDLTDNNPRLDLGLVIGFDAEIFDNIILEPSFGNVFELSSFIRSKKESHPFLAFSGWLSVRIAYRFRKGD